MIDKGICLSFAINSNGLQGGDAGHGGRTDIIISSTDCAYMEVNGEQVDEVKLSFCGDWELEDCAQAFERMAIYLNQKIKESKY